MRHRKGFNHLSRKSAHRKAMFANMAASLILNKRIQTTTAKAKALRMFIEPLITKSKTDSTHSRRVVFRYLRNKYAVTELFREISPKIAERPGGYTRILKTGNRLGDNADMCIIELVDYNENMLAAKIETKAKTTRRRRGGKKKSTEPVAETSTTDVAVEEIPEVSDETRDEEKTDTVATSEEPGTSIVEDEIKESTEEVEEETEKTDPTAETKTESPKTDKK
ncbi:MAG: 50S ribosomal protein L17 [Bacteroidales bacterium]|nr:50S ribosomal protein L17 [Bacteroidales bacterium]